MTFLPEKVDEFLEIYKNSREKIQAMPGCQYLELLNDVSNPNVFTTYSKWDSEEDLNNYRNSDVFGKVWPRTKALFAEKPVAWSTVKIE
jgi:quinol monooxygenase YgiN